MKDEPSVPTGTHKAVTNTLMVSSLNEMSIGTANLVDGRSAQGTQEQAYRICIENANNVAQESES